MEEQIAQFRFLKYEILNASIDIKNPQDISNDLHVNFGYTNDLSVNDNVILEMEANIVDDKENLKIHLIAKGYFEFKDELNDVQRANFININAPAILFPYIRAYISTLTALSGINPLILPTLNLSGRNNKI
jgi:preprotein translocase subunit SecB